MRIDRKKISVLLAQKQLSQTAFASLSGISRQTLSYIMNGKSCRPEIAGKVAQSLDVDVTEIIETENK